MPSKKDSLERQPAESAGEPEATSSAGANTNAGTGAGDTSRAAARADSGSGDAAGGRVAPASAGPGGESTGSSDRRSTATGTPSPAGDGTLTPANADARRASNKQLTAATGTPKKQYIVGKKSGPMPLGVQPLDLNTLEANFKLAGVEVVKKLSPPAVLGAFAGPGQSELLVARMTEEQANTVKQGARGAVVIEPDHPVSLALPQPFASMMPDPGTVAPANAGFAVMITVLGTNNTPVQGANVFLFGSVWPSQGVTDANGQVQLTLFETPSTLKGLYVKPQADYWSFWLEQPPVDPMQNNVVTLKSFDETFANFPNQQLMGWGQKAMKLDQLPATLRGAGVKIGVIDSGAAPTHRDLQAMLKGGYDTIAEATANVSWQEDTVMHGSHCAGIIAGADDGRGIRGFAPAADVFAYKIFPDGRFSNLIDAMNKCIENQLDVLNLSLGSDQRSDLVEQKLQEAKEAGIACIVAAGNSGGPVQYPASSKHVLAVSAVGKQGEFPSESYHSTTVLPAGSGGGGGYFPAKFSCFGGEIGVCGPGVAIVSSVPPDNFAAWDGTSMATPHITGLAALILAHHPDFNGPQAPYRQRNARRVDRLFQILKESAQPLNFGDPTRTGAGLPDATKALRGAAVPAGAGGGLAPAGFSVAPVGGGGVPASAPSAGGQSTGKTNSELDRLTAALEKAGLASGGPGIASAGTAPGSNSSSGEDSLRQLGTALDKAGLGAEQRPGGVASMSAETASGTDPQSALQRLAEKLRTAGL